MDPEEIIEQRVRERIAEVVEKRSSQLKAKFREQALKAVDEAREEGFKKGQAQARGSLSSSELLRDAEKRGYNRAHEELKVVVKKAEDERKRYQALDALIKDNFEEGNSADGDHSSPIIQYIIEQVYRDMKAEFENDNKDTIKRVKGTLLHSSKVLTKKIPNLSLSKKNDTRGNHGVDFIRIPRVFKLFCVAHPPILNAYTRVEVPYSLKRRKVVKGYIIDGEEDVVVYGIASGLYILEKDDEHPGPRLTASGRVHYSERRWSEFKAFYSSLKRSCPDIVLPPLPEASILDSNTLNALGASPAQMVNEMRIPDELGTHNATETSPSEQTKMEVRQYLIKLWLCSIANHVSLQTLPIVKDFFFGDTSVGSRAAAYMTFPDYDNFAKKSDNMNGCDALSSALPAQTSSCFEVERKMLVSATNPISPSLRPRYVVELALKDLTKIENDAKRIRRAISDTITSISILNNVTQSRYRALKRCGNFFSSYGILESDGVAICMGSDTLGWGLVSNTLVGPRDEVNSDSKTASKPTAVPGSGSHSDASFMLMNTEAKIVSGMGKVGAQFQFHDSILGTALRMAETSRLVVAKGLPTGSSTGMDPDSRQSSFSGPSRDAAVKHLVNPLSRGIASQGQGYGTNPQPDGEFGEENSTPKHQELAVGAAEQYDIVRRLRTTSVLSEFGRIAEDIAAAHRQSKQVWQTSLQDLLDLDMDYDSRKTINNSNSSRGVGLGNDYQTLVTRHKELNQAFKQRKKAQRTFCRMQSQLQGRSFPWMKSGQQDDESEGESEGQNQTPTKAYESNVSSTSEQDKDENGDNAQTKTKGIHGSGDYSLFRHSSQAGSPQQRFRGTSETRAREGQVDVAAMLSKPVLPPGKRARPKHAHILSGIFPLFKSASSHAATSAPVSIPSNAQREEHHDNKGENEKDKESSQSFSQLLFGASLSSSFGNTANNSFSMHLSEDDSEDEYETMQDARGTRQDSLFDAPKDNGDGIHSEERFVSASTIFGGSDNDDDSVEEGDLFGDSIADTVRSPDNSVRGVPDDEYDEEAEIRAELAKAREEDTPMNRALTRQKVRQRREHAIAEEKKRAAQLQQRRTEDSVYDSNQRRLAHRAGGGSGAHASIKLAASRKGKHRGAPTSGGVGLGVDMHNELFGAPKPAETKMTAPGASTATSAPAVDTGYLGGLHQEDMNLPVRTQEQVPPRGLSQATSQADKRPFDDSQSNAALHAAKQANETKGSSNRRSRSSTAQSKNDSVGASNTRPYQRTHDESTKGSQESGGGADGLPEGWQAVACDDGRVYYYHEVSRLSRWDKPSAKLATQHAERLQESKAREEAEVTRRRREREQEEERQVQEMEKRQAMSVGLKKRIEAWRRRGRFGDAQKDIYDLLNTVHTICDFVPPPSSEVGADGQMKEKAPVLIKKAYMRAVRHIHPDKLPSSLSLEQRVVAEAVFVVITEEYNAWRASA